MTMHRIAASVTVGLTLITVATCQFRLPCDSGLRSYSILAPLFAHCECVYSNWTEWANPINAISIPVPRNQCDSGMARPEERWQTVISGYECENNRSEVRHICSKLHM